MKWALLIMLAAISSAVAQTPTPAERSFFNRMLHPFGSAKTKAPKYQDPRLRGLLLEVQVPTEPVRLSEVRQLRVHVALTNLSGNPISLDFPSSQRIDIQLLNPAGEVSTRWSENRAFTEEIGNVLNNPSEHICYNETISTRTMQTSQVYSERVSFA